MSAIEEHKEKRRALGRGLDSLLPSGPRLATATVPAPAVMPPPVVIPTDSSGEIAEIHAGREANPHVSQKTRDMGHPTTEVNPEIGHPTSAEDSIQQIALDHIDENPYQTRRTFDEAALQELAESIKESGLAQPVVVRPGANGRYVLVLGERRCRASKLAGKATVPAIVRHLGNEQAAELTVIENLQRQDLNCLEQAQAFARLSREFGLTQEQIGKRVGSSRESVANYMRLLKLPQSVLDLIGAGKLDFSQARVLLEAAVYLDTAGLERMAQDAVDQQSTVKELNARLQWLKSPIARAEESPKEKMVDPNVKDAERRLRETLGMRVKVMAYQGNKGQVVIRYESLADFDRILDLLGRE
ncbi:MAG TPA: ParB/RepB/Spo0J family partition protein [Terriglobales bacterium]|nr:ParB/RepB/Spo0J family partition protein [Terriglobales bacterium]